MSVKDLFPDSSHLDKHPDPMPSETVDNGDGTVTTTYLPRTPYPPTGPGADGHYPAQSYRGGPDTFRDQYPDHATPPEGDSPAGEYDGGYGDHDPGPEDPAPKPLPVFDRKKAKAAGAAGMAQALDGRESDAARLFAAVKAVALTEQLFTSDTVFKSFPELEAVRNHKVMGPVMLRASREAVCRATGQFLKGDRVVAHGRPLRVWESLTYQGKKK